LTVPNPAHILLPEILFARGKTVTIKKLTDVPLADLQGYDNVDKQIVIGPHDGSNEIVLRNFTLAPGGSTPHHSHDWPHLVKIEAGTGIAIDEAGNEKSVQAGDFVYVKDNDMHQFRNTGTTPFSFICIVPVRGES
jgi:quercetin dioxygenase-like cupin family protein